MSTAAELRPVFDAALEKRAAAVKKLNGQLKGIFDKLIEASAEIGVSLQMNSISPDMATVVVQKEGKPAGYYDFTVYFRKKWGSKDKHRDVQLNVGTFGSFGANDKQARDFYTAAGLFANRLPKLEEAINMASWAEFDEANREAYDIQAKYDAAQAAERQAEIQQKKDAILSKLIVGAKLRVGKKRNGDLIFDKIIKVTPKLIFLEHDFGSQTKKEHAVENLLRKKWEFAG